MDRLIKYKRTDEYQAYKCHAYFEWNTSYTLCGRRMNHRNDATDKDRIDCYGCLNAIERIRSY